MSPSPSDPYQSRFVKTVIRQTRQWFDRGQTTLRRMQVAASWSTQILLYPIYALFQTSRLIGQKIGQAAQTHSLELEAEDTENYQIPLKVQTETLTTDSPIQNVLEAVQTLALPGDVPVLAKAPDIKIRAIASLIEEKSLVLVTNHNQVLDVLTLEQQITLHKQIIVAIAVYARQVRSRRLQPKWATRVLQGVRQFVQPLLPKQPAASLAQLLPAPEENDPIRAALLEVDRLLQLSESSALPALPQPRSDLITHSSLQPSPPVYIRGVVSLLPGRAIALATNENTVLDILSLEQQQFIHQRITWEVAHYGRYLRLRNQAEGLLAVQPPNRFSRMLAPVWGFQWLMTWMQSGAIALSTNLFQEASLNACPLPAAPPSTNSLPQRPQNPFQRLLKNLRPLISPTADAPGPISTIPSEREITLSTDENQPEIEPTNLAAYSYINATEDLAVETSAPSNPSHVPNYVDTDATLMGYEQSWLERVLHWLDRGFFWVEKWISLLWKRLTGG